MLLLKIWFKLRKYTSESPKKKGAGKEFISKIKGLHPINIGKRIEKELFSKKALYSILFRKTFEEKGIQKISFEPVFGYFYKTFAEKFPIRCCFFYFDDFRSTLAISDCFKAVYTPLVKAPTDKNSIVLAVPAYSKP